MEALLAGLALGLGSGVAPGPLLALAIVTTLHRGLGGGLQVAVAPLVSDVLIIVLTVVFVGQLPATAVTVLSIVGGLVVGALAIETLRAARVADVVDLRTPPPERRDTGLLRHLERPWAKAAAVNLLNPAPWLFWATVGAPALIGYREQSTLTAAAFLLGFYPGLVSSKAVIVAGIAAGRHRLTTPVYRMVLASSGIMLAAFAVAFVWRGVSALV